LDRSSQADHQRRLLSWLSAPECEDALSDALKRAPSQVTNQIQTVLAEAKAWQLADERSRKVLGTRGTSRGWLDDRRKLLHDLDKLERRIRRIYRGAVDERLAGIYLRTRDVPRSRLLRDLLLDDIFSGPPVRYAPLLLDGTFMRAEINVIQAMVRLRAAVKADPVLSAPGRQDGRGRPARPWLTWAFAELRRLKVSRERIDELFRWTGLKPEN